MEKLFKLKENGTNVKTEIIAGITTFLAMAYILAVNPGYMEAAGIPKGAAFSATAISAAIATLCMAFFANYPVALVNKIPSNLKFGITAGIGPFITIIALINAIVSGVLSQEPILNKESFEKSNKYFFF